jgi:hypothetical protein
MLRIPIKLPSRIKPVRGFAHLAHLALLFLLPLAVYILVRINFVSLAIIVIFLSKWRMFAVRPRDWIANLVANGVDIIVGISLVLFMANTTVVWWQLFWAAAYAGWLTWLKPKSDVLNVSIQAMVGQLLGLFILYLKFGDNSLLLLVVGTWVITYVAARHFLTSFEEPLTALLAHSWAYFSAGLAFILGHWLLFYGTVPQIIVILTTVGYGLAALYYLDATDRLNSLMQKQLLAIMAAILLIVIVLSDWTGATV